MPKIISNYIELHITFNNKFLLMKRSESNSIYPNLWQMITGRVEKNEKAFDTAIRELKEETGLCAGKVYIVPRVNTFYLHFIDSITMSPVFLAFVNSDDVIISPEHSEYKWVTYEEAMELIHWESQKESLIIIREYMNDEKLFAKLVEVRK